MALKITHQPGEPIKAVDMNSNGKAIIQNAQNIYELFLENELAAKSTPIHGMFLDGFLNTDKADTAATQLTAQASSGQKILTVGDTSDFKDGQTIQIYDGTNQEVKVIDTVDSGTQITVLTNLANIYAASSDVKRTSGTINTTEKRFEMGGGIGDDKKVIYHSVLNSFQQAMETAKLWITRSIASTILKLGTHSIDLERSSTQYLKHADNAILSPTGDITIEMWVKIEQFGVTHYLNTKGGSSPQFSWRWSIEPAGKFAFIFSSDGTFGTITNAETSDGTFDSGDVGKWVHVALAIDVSTATFIPYKNGVPVSVTTYHTQNANSIFDGTGDFKIGQNENLTQNFDGLIDDVRLWDDIRTTQEINDNMSIELTGSEGNLIGYWKLNNDYTDSSPNSNTLTPINAPVFSTDTPITAGLPAFNLKAAIIVGATTLKIAGDQTGKFANGDTIYLFTSDNLLNERKTLTAAPTYAGGPDETTLTFAATTNAYGTDDFVERVNVEPKVSIVDKDADESMSAMTFVKAIVDFDNGLIEEEYSFTAGMANEDVVLELILTREDITLAPIIKKYGILLNT